MKSLSIMVFSSTICGVIPHVLLKWLLRKEVGRDLKCFRLYFSAPFTILGVCLSEPMIPQLAFPVIYLLTGPRFKAAAVLRRVITELAGSLCECPEPGQPSLKSMTSPRHSEQWAGAFWFCVPSLLALIQTNKWKYALERYGGENKSLSYQIWKEETRAALGI